MENFTNETPVVEETTILEETPVAEKVEATVEPVEEAPAEKNKVFAILALIAGIVSIPMACCYGSSIPFGVASIIFYILDKKKNAGASGQSKAGLICGIIGLVIGVIMIVLVAIGIAASSSMPYYY